MDSEPKETGESGDFIFILDNFNLTEGFLYKFNVYLNTTDPVIFQIYRPDADNSTIYHLVYEIGPVQATDGPGFYEVG